MSTADRNTRKSKILSFIIINSGRDAPDDGDCHGGDPENLGEVPKEVDKVPKDLGIFPVYF